MNNKSRYIYVIIIVLILLFISKKLYQEDIEIPHSHKKIPEKTIITPSYNVQINKITSPVLPEIIESKKSQTTPHLIANFQLKKVFNCDMSIDESLIEQVNQTLELYSYEVPLRQQEHQINDLLAIRVISSDLPINFAKTINEKIKLILLIYKDWFGLTLEKPTTLNLVLLPNLESYSDVLSTLSIDSTNSQGIFWANSNFSFVAYRNEKQLQQTIIHELVHALNFYFVGYSARWLTEGLAEYFENIEFQMKDDTYVYSLNIPKAVSSLSIDELVYLEKEWDSNQRSSLYASALQVVAYFIKHKEDKNILRHLLHKETVNPCTKLENATYLNLINESLIYLSSEF